MKSHTSVSKITRKTADGPSQHSSSGENAVAIVPPDYGIDFVDNGMAATALVQRVGELEDEEMNPLQGKFDAAPMQLQQGPDESPPNRTGMPYGLKAGIESLSGVEMSGVRVHYNFSKPARYNALAYAQGNEIHLGSGQERHLPHEAWHVVQQAQGRVRPTMQMKGGVEVNDDIGLEREADVMGDRALNHARTHINTNGNHDEQSTRNCAKPLQYSELLNTNGMKGMETILKKNHHERRRAG